MISVSFQETNSEHSAGILFLVVIILMIILTSILICCLIWFCIKDKLKIFEPKPDKKPSREKFGLGEFSKITSKILLHKYNGKPSERKGDSKEMYIPPFETGKPSGLKNNSTECYMNSIIQAVASSDKLIEQFKEIQLKYKDFDSLNYFVELLQSVNESDDSYDHLCKNTDLLEKLIRSVKWTKPSQQDAFELLSALVNGIHQDFKSENFKLENLEMPMKFKIVHRFKGINIPNKMQDQISLSLRLCGEYSTGVTIEYLIDQYFQPKIIDDDPNKTSRISLYREAPDVLLLHIQANKWDNEKGKMVKPKYYIKYDKEISLCLNIADELNNDEFERITVNYSIKAVVQHIGKIDGGHYITYRNWNNKWFLVNDEHVESIKFNNDICPYIMIYEKC